MRILFIGDIVGEPGRRAVEALVPRIAKREYIDFIIANGENVAGGSGLTSALADQLFDHGIDVITSGDHIWKRKEMASELDVDNRVIRPANYPEGVPGFGHGIFESKEGIKIGVLNLVGRVFMQPVECPFRTAKAIVDKIRDKTRIIIVDMHAEATSEKIALGYYLDGHVSAVLGTHTHVQTSDEKILSEGTAYISDTGMTGPFDGVIGRKKDAIIRRFLTQLPVRFEMAEGDIQLHGVIIDIDDKTGKANSIKRVQEKF
jgi:metallophosphoesterase (TIGR00282 family)